MLDRYVVAGHDDALDEQLDETLAPREVQIFQPGAQRRGKGLQVVGQPIDVSLMLVLGSKLLTARARRLLRRVQTLAPRLELLHRHRAGLIGVHEPLDLPLEPPLRRLEACPIPRPLGHPLSARSPRLDLLLEHRWRLDPRHERVPDDRIELIAPHAPRLASRVVSALDGDILSALVIEVLVV
jgi:hypothetical protein